MARLPTHGGALCAGVHLRLYVLHAAASPPSLYPFHLVLMVLSRVVVMWMVALHSLLLFALMITLNVAVNSTDSSLFVLLVSNNFIELKGTVFKKYYVTNLFQLACAGTAAPPVSLGVV